MHKFKLNHFKIEFSLSPKSPILIKSGGISPNPALPDMQFVRTFIAGRGECIYVPGSSLKGVLRSYVEKTIKTVLEEGEKGTCDLFRENCAKKLDNEEKSYVIYKKSCKVCKIFGNTKLKSRISVTDAYPEGNVKTEIRHGVAISRLTHAVAQGPFDMEVVVDGRFNGKLILENFECWQVGLIIHALNALREGWLKIGFGKNRGLGEVNVEINKIEFDFIKKTEQPQDEIWGVGKFLEEEERKSYGVVDKDFCKVGKPDNIRDDVFFINFLYSKNKWNEISKKFIEKVMEMINNERLHL